MRCSQGQPNIAMCGKGMLTCIKHGCVEGNVRARAQGGDAKVAEALSRVSGGVEGDDCVLALAVSAVGEHHVRGVGRLRAAREDSRHYACPGRTCATCRSAKPCPTLPVTWDALLLAEHVLPTVPACCLLAVGPGMMGHPRIHTVGAVMQRGCGRISAAHRNRRSHCGRP